MANNIRIDLIISGKVQGVGYRYFIKKKAESLGILGYVINKKDGSVFIAAQGDKKDLDNLIEYCHRGTPFSIVKSVKKIPNMIDILEEFHIKY